MPYRLLADFVLLAHFAFVAFVALGVLLVLRWRSLAWLHLPALAWGVFVEIAGVVCPLTPLEIQWRAAAGEAGYSGGFVEHYVTAVIYPEGLTRETQVVLGLLVAAVNVPAYWWMARGRRLPSRKAR